MDELLQEFVAETRETLEALAGEIVAWEADPADRARLDAIFRFVHTVKGSCGFLDLPRLERLSHAAEDVLAAVRAGDRVPDAALVDAVLAIVDRIGELVEAIDAGVALDDSAEDLLIAALAEDAAPASAGPAHAAAPRAPSRSIRLGVDLLDRMMGGMSDMVLARNELARQLRDVAVDPRVEAALERLSLTVSDMRETVTRTRMQKIEALFAPLPRLVRDIAAQLGKAVTLSVDGADVELDREMIELLRDPLVHIVRNSLDHGIELPAVRRAAGKREAGRLLVSARQSGNQILIEIVDDGAGIDTARVAAKAVSLGLVSESQVAAMSAKARLDLVFLPGLSSREEVTAISGRGVGMDVVRANIEQAGGRIELSSEPGRGLTTLLQVPLTLSIISTVVVTAGGQQFALPRQSVEEIVAINGGSVRLETIGDADVVSIRGERLPMVALNAVLGVAGEASSIIIVATRDGRFALSVDTVVDTEEVVVKPAAPAVMATGLYAGQSLPDSGRPLLLLDGSGVAAAAGIAFDAAKLADIAAVAEQEAPGLPALLFVDLDGQRRAIVLAAVDHVETHPAGDVRVTGGVPRLVDGDRLLPLRLQGVMPSGDTVTILRLTDGEAELGYVIAEPLDIVDLPSDAALPGAAGLVSGVVLLDDEPVEILDAHALFADAAASAADRPACLIEPDAAGWMTSFLRPMIEAAGYRCVLRGEAATEAAVTLALDDAGLAPSPSVVRLYRDRSAVQSGGVFRYDRAGLLDILAERVGGVRR